MQPMLLPIYNFVRIFFKAERGRGGDNFYVWPPDLQCYVKIWWVHRKSLVAIYQLHLSSCICSSLHERFLNGYDFFKLDSLICQQSGSEFIVLSCVLTAIFYQYFVTWYTCSACNIGEHIRFSAPQKISPSRTILFAAVNIAGLGKAKRNRRRESVEWNGNSATRLRTRANTKQPS